LHQGHLQRLPASHLLYAVPWFLWLLPATVLSLNTVLLVSHGTSRERFLGGMPLTLGQGRLTDRGLLLVRAVLPLGFAVVSTGLTVLLMNWHVRLSEQEMGVRTPGSLEERLYSYDQIRHVIRTGRQTERYFVIFDDGAVVDPFVCRDVISQDDENRSAPFITARTGKPLRVVRSLGEVKELAGELP